MARVGVHIHLSEQTHRPAPGHPENVRRLEPTAAYLKRELAAGRLEPFTLTEHGLDPVLRVHSNKYVEQLQTLCAIGDGYLDSDTYFTSTSFDAAIAVVDVLLSAVDTVFTTDLRRIFVLGRPPGHHAEYDRAMGFCLINNVAVAAQYAIDMYHLDRVAIFDFDVHHGNGTQHIFYDRSDVLYISTHEYPFYPGTGSAQETGSGAGKGYTLNCPFPVSSGDDEFDAALQDQILPALRRYQPQIVLVSAGFDALKVDPLAGLNFSASAYYHAAKGLCAIADQFCDGRIVSMLEGGYSPEGNLDAITNYIHGLSES